MGSKAKGLLHLQYIIGWSLAWFFAPLVYLTIRYFFRYRVDDIRKIRKASRRLFRQHKGPWLICANHLTMIDSVVLAYALFPMHGCFFRYNLLPWNMPERANFQKNLMLTFLCYVAKCVPVARGGDREEMKQVLEKCLFLLRKKQNFLIFPEGGRSRTGRVDTQNFTYGVGRFLQEADNCRVLCVYLRGDHQDQYSNMPYQGERFTCLVDPLDISRNDQRVGLRAQRHYTEQIIHHLAAMEERYFACRRE
jgi:1-acyl-sn-glycerol-3-phosphate acyltransferase